MKITKVLKYLLISSITLIFLQFPLFAQNVLRSPVGDTNEWKMHLIDNDFWNHNSLSPGDVNKDGYTDYCVIHEGSDVYTILFHPGKSGDVRKPWKKVVIGDGYNVEYAYLGDLDGDGNLDVVGAEGLSKESTSGARIFWGPDKEKVYQPDAWQRSELMPGTINQGHYLYCETHDVNDDGALDIVLGGRVLETNNSVGGLKWIEAPGNPKDRRNLSKWKTHYIDSTLLSGHGFEFVDIDQDGNKDFLIGNADWDTPDSEEQILWYENPGYGSPLQKEAWESHRIDDTKYEYFAKNQVAYGDINGDGLIDVVSQSDNRIFLHFKKSNKPVTWEHVVIQKPAITSWVTRPLKLIDLDGDGQLEIVGALIHNWGNLPRDKASVFWMKSHGDVTVPENWHTNVIKWSDGIYSGRKFTGEKWDHLRFVDVDGDGDLDIVGNCEEYYKGASRDSRQTIVGAVWFENQLND
jgi:hypothetical protein